MSTRLFRHAPFVASWLRVFALKPLVPAAGTGVVMLHADRDGIARFVLLYQHKDTKDACRARNACPAEGQTQPTRVLQFATSARTQQPTTTSWDVQAS